MGYLEDLRRREEMRQLAENDQKALDLAIRIQRDAITRSGRTFAGELGLTEAIALTLREHQDRGFKPGLKEKIDMGSEALNLEYTWEDNSIREVIISIAASVGSIGFVGQEEVWLSADPSMPEHRELVTNAFGEAIANPFVHPSPEARVSDVGPSERADGYSY